jgi:threonine synthase
MVLVTDDQMCQAMARVYDELKFTLEPAGAAVIAALAGPWLGTFDRPLPIPSGQMTC